MFKIKEKGVTEYSPSFGVRLRTTSYDGEPLKSNTLSIYLGKRYWYIEVPYFLKHHKKWEDLSKYDWATSDGYWDNFDKEYGFSFNTRDCSGLFLYYGLQDDFINQKFKLFWYPWKEHYLGRQVLFLDGTRACSSGCFRDMYEEKDRPAWIVKDSERNDYRCNTKLGNNEYTNEYYGETIGTFNIVEEKIFIDPYDGKEILGRAWITKSLYTRGTNKFFRFIFGTLLRIKKSQYTLNVEFDEEYGKGKETWKGGTIGAYIPIDEYNGDIDVILKTKGYVTKSIQ